MEVKKQIYIDKWVLSPVVFCLNILVRIAGKIVRPSHNLNQDFKRIAVCKFKGMGSIVQSTPLLQSLKNTYPNSKLVFITSRANQALLHEMPFVDEQIILNDSSFLALIKSAPAFLLKVMRFRAQLYFDLEIYSNFSSVLSAFSMAKNRFGFFIRSGQFKPGIYTHMLFFNKNIPVSETYLQMLRVLPKHQIENKLYPFALKANEIQNTLAEFGLSQKPYFVINPNASDLRPERKWSSENYVELIREILKNYPNHLVVLVGSKSEMLYTQSIAKQTEHPSLINLAGKSNLKQLLHLIQNCALFITNDTGPMHLAFALGSKTVALFGPSSPQQFAHFIQGKIFYKNVYCSPCVHDFQIAPCRGNNQCMKQIKVSEVLESIPEVLNTQTQNTPKTNTLFAAEQQPLGLVSRPGREL